MKTSGKKLGTMLNFFSNFLINNYFLTVKVTPGEIKANLRSRSNSV